MKNREIRYEDDIVVVKDKKGHVIYKGMEDDEPNKYEDWRWNESRNLYEWNDLVKYRVA